MTHATRARKERGAKIAVVDVYNNSTMQQADIPLCLRPGTDGALACAIMHVLFRDGLANWEYLNKYADCPRELEEHPEVQNAGMGQSHYGAERFTNRRLRDPDRPDAANLSAPGLRLYAQPQRRGQHACRHVDRYDDRSLAA